MRERKGRNLQRYFIRSGGTAIVAVELKPIEETSLVSNNETDKVSDFVSLSLSLSLVFFFF